LKDENEMVSTTRSLLFLIYLLIRKRRLFSFIKLERLMAASIVYAELRRYEGVIT